MNGFIRKAEMEEWKAVRKLYDDCVPELEEWDFLPQGSNGGFPETPMILKAIEAGGQFVAEAEPGGELAGAIIANHEAVPEYREVPWQIEASDEECSMLHALRVRKKYQGRGLARGLMEAAVEDARAQGLKALRLDTVAGDDIAVHIYESLGFKNVYEREMQYAEIGDVPGVFYELVL